MDAQDFRSLQEAYMEVVENQQLDEKMPERICLSNFIAEKAQEK